ncbi:unnamed protein product, partial [Nesidiocoris tenuis]
MQTTDSLPDHLLYENEPTGPESCALAWISVITLPPPLYSLATWIVNQSILLSLPVYATSRLPVIPAGVRGCPIR